jgi:hypothetical protein
MSQQTDLKKIDKISGPRILTPLFLLSSKIQRFWAAVLNPLFMALLFFVIITPLSLAFRLLSRQSFKYKHKHLQSSWNPREAKPIDLDRQF